MQDVIDYSVGEEFCPVAAFYLWRLGFAVTLIERAELV
jgi:hypothetical protein